VLLADLAGSSRLSPVGIGWGLPEAVSLAAYFPLSAAAGETVLPPLVMAWGGLCAGAAFLAVATGAGGLHVIASAGDVELLHRHVSWIVPVLELSLVSAVIAYVAGIAAARRLGATLAPFTGMAEVFFAVLFAWLLPTRPKTRTNDAGADARRLLEHLAARHPGLLPGPRVEALRQILVQNYHWDCAGRLRWRDDEADAGLPPSAAASCPPTTWPPATPAGTRSPAGRDTSPT
jgi:hypothetical protein